MKLLRTLAFSFFLATFFALGFLVFPNTALAQGSPGTFICNPIDSSDGSGWTWVVSEASCGTGFVASGITCFNALGPPGPNLDPNLDLRVACVDPQVGSPSNSSGTTLWGHPCASEGSSTECTGSNLICRRGRDNGLYCLESEGTVQVGGFCRDGSECRPGTAGLVRCSMVNNQQQCNTDITVGTNTETSFCGNGVCEAGETGFFCYVDCKNNTIPNSIGAQPGSSKTSLPPFEFCNQVPQDQMQACIACSQAGSADGVPDRIFTAIGCIPIDGGAGMVGTIVTILLAISGGIALLTILAASATLTIAQGDSTKVKQAKELMTAAVSGLFFIIFSIMVMDFIGVRILHLPGLG